MNDTDNEIEHFLGPLFRMEEIPRQVKLDLFIALMNNSSDRNIKGRIWELAPEFNMHDFFHFVDKTKESLWKFLNGE